MKFGNIAAENTCMGHRNSSKKNPTSQNKQQFNKTQKIVVKIIHSAMSEFYLTEIILATSKKRLFTAFKKLSGLANASAFKSICRMGQLSAILLTLLLIMLKP